MAGRPGGDTALGAHGPVLRRRAPVELRRVRLARAATGVRHQRLRRDAAGAVGVGRQAAGREHADRGAGQRLPVKDQERVVLDTVEEYRTAMARVRRDEEPRGVVRAPGHRDRVASSPRSSSRRRTLKRRREARSRRRARATACRRSRNSRTGRRRARGSSPNRR